MTKKEILKKAERIAELKNLMSPLEKELKSIQAELLEYAENNADVWENLNNDKVVVEYVNGSHWTGIDKDKAVTFLTKPQLKECEKEYSRKATIRVKRVKG